MRLFVAILPPPQALAQLDAALGAVRARREGATGDAVPREPAAALRWVRPEQWHVTLAFLGEVPPPVAEAVAVRLARVAARHPPLTLAIRGGGRFGERVLWAGVTAWPAGAGGADHEDCPGAPAARGAAAASRDAGCPGVAAGPGDGGGRGGAGGSAGAGGLRALAASVRAAARRCGVPGQEPDSRYRPHLTLARARPGADLASPVVALSGFSGTPWQARELHLVRSELNAGPGGTALHTVLRTWPFTGGRP